MKTLHLLATVVAVLLCGATAGQAQPTYDLRFLPSVNTTQDTLTLRVQIKVDEGQHELGSSNLVFTYDTSVLAFPSQGNAVEGTDFVFFNFDDSVSGDYNASTVNQPTTGSISVNIDAGFDGGPGTPVGTSFMDVCSVRVKILDKNGTSSFAWDGANTFVFGTAQPPVEWTQGTLSSETDVNLPVELTAFEAVADGGSLQLNWTTASETNNVGFDVQYAHRDSSTFRSAAFVEGQGTSNTETAYAYRFAPGTLGTYRVRLKQVDFDGAFVYLPEVEVTVTQLENAEGAQVDYLLGAPTPNPFTGRATLVLQTATAQHVRASLYNTLGQRVQTVLDRPLAAGSAQVLAVSANGLAAGLYILHVEGETFSETRELVVAR